MGTCLPDVCGSWTTVVLWMANQWTDQIAPALMATAAAAVGLMWAFGADFGEVKRDMGGVFWGGGIALGGATVLGWLFG